MSIALMVRIEALERRLAALEKEMIVLKAAPKADKPVKTPAPVKKKTP